jgi:hypothetical protein
MVGRKGHLDCSRRWQLGSIFQGSGLDGVGVTHQQLNYRRLGLGINLERYTYEECAHYISIDQTHMNTSLLHFYSKDVSNHPSNRL